MLTLSYSITYEMYTKASSIVIFLFYVVCRHFSVYPIRANTLNESLNIYRKDHMSETDKMSVNKSKATFEIKQC
jgi:hypothetical protein